MWWKIKDFTNQKWEVKQEHARAKAEVDSNQDQQWISHDIPNKSAGTKQLTWVGDCQKKMVVQALYKL